MKVRLGLTCLVLAIAAIPAYAPAAGCNAENLGSANLVILEAKPVRSAKDVTRRARARVAPDDAFSIKVRRAARLAQSFNNQPRYELAAYELQKLLFETENEVVPPTALRSMRLQDFQSIDPLAEETFRGTGATLFIVQCWLAGAKPHPLAIDETRFAAEAAYALAISNLNVLTYLIEHKDANAGNVMLVQNEDAVRAWAIDNGVAFESEDSDRGDYWRALHVRAIDPRLHERLTRVERATLDRTLGVVAEFALVDGNWVARPSGANLRPTSGVRRVGEVLQLGLNRKEIGAVQRRIDSLLERVRQGRLSLLPVPPD
jgi:hypothetical protein